MEIVSNDENCIVQGAYLEAYGEAWRRHDNVPLLLVVYGKLANVNGLTTDISFRRKGIQRSVANSLRCHTVGTH